MNKTTLLAAVAALALGAAAPAMAQDAAANFTPGFNASVGYTGIFADSDGSDLNLGGATARVGYRFLPYVGVEGEFTAGIQDDDFSVGGVSVDVELEKQYAGYVVGYVPLSAQTDLFARLGYGNIDIKVSAAGFSDSDDTDAVSYGAGVQHFFDGANGVRAEYTRFDFDEDGEADSLSVSYVRKF